MIIWKIFFDLGQFLPKSATVFFTAAVAYLHPIQKTHLDWVKSSMKNISLLFLNDSFAFQIIRPVHRQDVLYKEMEAIGARQGGVGYD